mmetsp:Transcript_853/g.729  ORF Transcript_853/g.729 Transcript_853/m.729 type:complete len:367 (+) Transcript_853:3-1103(+)
MSQFYQKYKSLFEGGSNIAFPSKERKFTNEYGYAYMQPKDVDLGGLAGFSNKNKPIISQTSVIPRKHIDPIKKIQSSNPLGFNPNPRSRDPLKWNFSRGMLDERKSFDHSNNHKPYSLPPRSQHSYQAPKHVQSFRNLRDAAKPSGYIPFATDEENNKNIFNSEQGKDNQIYIKKYDISVPYGVDSQNKMNEEMKNEEAYLFKQVKRRGRRLHSPTQSMPDRGAGISIVELEKKRNHEYTLDNEERRNDTLNARSIFDKSDKISNTLAFRVKKSDMAEDAKSHFGSTRAHHNLMLRNKVKGEEHFEFGKNEEDGEINVQKILSTILPYGEPSKHCPNVPTEECLHRRKEAKKYLKQRQIKLKEILK